MPFKTRLTFVQWTICVIASIGFAFDIYELLMLPLIVRPALLDLVGAKPGTPEFEFWVSMLFFLPAMAGGIFGLLGGYLTDLLGRRRVLVWSILLYAFSACASGFSTSIYMLLFFRCTTFIGVCVEFVAAVAWLAELFPEPKRREAVLGFTQAFSSVGGLLVTGANYLVLQYGDLLYPIYGNHEAWRYTLISGVIPALPLIIIRPFLPESPQWAAKKAAGTLRRPSIRELFAPELRRTTMITTLMFACSYGAAFGALQHTPRIVPSLPQVKEMTAGKPVPEQKKIEQETAATVNFFQEIGGLAGRFLLAVLAIWVVSRRSSVASVPGPRLDSPAVALFLSGARQLGAAEMGHLLCGALHGRPVQLLGQLPAASVSVASARHGREFRREYRRTHAGHFCRLAHHLADHADARKIDGPGCRGRRPVCLCDRVRALLLAARTKRSSA